jgi:hypothetical protein
MNDFRFGPPAPTTWKVTRKPNERAWILSEEDFIEYQTLSFAVPFSKGMNHPSHNIYHFLSLTSTETIIPHGGPTILMHHTDTTAKQI